MELEQNIITTLEEHQLTHMKWKPLFTECNNKLLLNVGTSYDGIIDTLTGDSQWHPISKFQLNHFDNDSIFNINLEEIIDFQLTFCIRFVYHSFRKKLWQISFMIIPS